ncbi:MAG TPA: YpzG family protein [Pseudobacillus sp.]
MSKKDWLDPNSQKFHHNWTRPKRTNSQMNGHTEVSLRTRINQSVSNENRFC